MRVTSRFLPAALAAALLLNLAPLAFAREGAKQVKAEIDSLQESLKDNPVSDKNLAGLVSTTRNTLDAAERELAAGRLYLSLEDLGRAESLLLGLRVVALAVESPEDQVRPTVAGLSHDLYWAITDAPTAQSFGDITSVPTMFLFDSSGKTVGVLYGAPPDLHDRVEKLLEPLLR